MHPPSRNTSMVPGLTRLIIPRTVDGLDRHHVPVLHGLHGPLNQPARNSPTAQAFINVPGVDNADSTRFDDRRNRFPVVDAANEKSRESRVFLGDISNA